jgi:hypothetical protein
MPTSCQLYGQCAAAATEPFEVPLQGQVPRIVDFALDCRAGLSLSSYCRIYENEAMFLHPLECPFLLLQPWDDRETAST